MACVVPPTAVRAAWARAAAPRLRRSLLQQQPRCAGPPGGVDATGDGPALRLVENSPPVPLAAGYANGRANGSGSTSSSAATGQASSSSMMPEQEPDVQAVQAAQAPANPVPISTQLSSSEQELEQQPGLLPHRWRIVFMMAAAFVLCNMDKVCAYVCVLGRGGGASLPLSV